MTGHYAMKKQPKVWYELCLIVIL